MLALFVYVGVETISLGTLIGLRQLATELFTGIDWSTWAVLHETRTRLRRLGWQWKELEEKWDVDRPEDLKRMDLDTPDQTRAIY